MPRLMLLRHAKSSWSEEATADFDRPLAPRGQKAAPLMGRYMKENGLLPDRVLCSSALRTRQTFAEALPFLAGDFDALFLRAIYDTLDDDYLDIIREHGGDAATLLVIGHNPATHETALALAGTGNTEDIARLEDGFPTAALAILDFEGADWSGLKSGAGHLVSFIKPRELETANGSDDGSEAAD